MVYSSSNSVAGLLPEKSALVSTSPALARNLSVIDQPLSNSWSKFGADEQHLRAAAIGEIRIGAAVRIAIESDVPNGFAVVSRRERIETRIGAEFVGPALDQRNRRDELVLVVQIAGIQNELTCLRIRA